MPQDTANKNLCKHTQYEKPFLLTPAKGMAYIHGTATKMTVCIYNAQHPLIIDSGEHYSIVARICLENHFPNWENQLLPTKAKNFKSASGKMTSIGTIIKKIITPHRKGNIKLNPEFVVLDDWHIQGFLLGQITRGFMVLIFTIVKTGTLPLVPRRKRNFHLIYTKYLPKNLWKNY
ncbi:hypothetical protein O181_029797 [Austropuccinia psidii MF-1]|uniref:Uncharacterized protein n=1 Tax=Austropuccinia psidii MF-1 TaxID=1389203 RepID=A0A9Q3CXB0_9BASI|nr:hypothetical protein [Austropuccinia psidii MF-1]